MQRSRRSTHQLGSYNVKARCATGRRQTLSRCSRTMRFFIKRPRTLLKLTFLVSLPSLVMFVYVYTQAIPIAIVNSLSARDLSIFPAALSNHGLQATPIYDDLATTNSYSDIVIDSSYEDQSKYGTNFTNISAGQNDDLHNAAFIAAQHNAEQQAKFLSDSLAAILPTDIRTRDIQNKLSPEEMERYFMENYHLNKEKGFGQFSLSVTEGMIEGGPLQLPELLPNLNVPCWVEEVPKNFTYDNNLYNCHINHRRIRAGFDAMYSWFGFRERYSGIKWRLRCLPSFYLIGVAKCGTTDLFEAITRHPQVLKPDLKEPEFWPYLRFGLNDLIINMSCAHEKKEERATFADYMDTYDLTSEMVKESLRRDENGNLYANVFFGDYSTHTFIDIFDWDKTLDAPQEINAHHIHNVWPKSKFILILRDPVDRSYSRYKMRMTRQGNVGGTNVDFHKRVLKQIKTTEDCMEQHSRRYCVYKAKYGVGNTGTNALVNTGLYSIYLVDWLSIFPREQILILKFEEYITNRTGILEHITKFLGITDSLPGPYRDIIDSMVVVNAGPEIGGILPETRQALQVFYEPFNRELVELLQDDRFTWGY